MKTLVYFFCFALIGTSYGQDYCPSNATGCEGCSTRWDYHNITSKAYIQTNGLCTYVFYWPFDYQQDDFNPWLTFHCKYSETGATCNSRYETTCASCLSYTITDINVLYDPNVIYYDSCDYYFNIDITQPCVNAVDGTTKHPITNPVLTTTATTSHPSKEPTVVTTPHPSITQRAPTAHSPVSTTHIREQTSILPTTREDGTTSHHSSKFRTSSAIHTLKTETPKFTTKVSPITSKPRTTEPTTHQVSTKVTFPSTHKAETTLHSSSKSLPISIITTHETKPSHVSTEAPTVTSRPPVTTLPQVSTTQYKTKTTNLPFTHIPPNCNGCNNCTSCPENFVMPEFNQQAEVHGNGECTVTFTWDYPYNEDVCFEFLCHYLDGENCHKEEAYVCGSCETYTIHNIKNYEDPILTISDSCNNTLPVRITPDCFILPNL